MEHLDQFSAARQLRERFFDVYPESEAAYARRLGALEESKSDQVEPLLREAMRKHPKSVVFQVSYAHQVHMQDGVEEGAKAYAKVAELFPDSAYAQGWTGRLFLKAKEDEGKAVHYYLNAYFLDPDFYDTEFAEFRIRTLSQKSGRKAYASLTDAGSRIRTALTYENPAVVVAALDELARRWDPGFTDDMVRLMAHDCVEIRWSAMQVLLKNVDRSFDEELKRLLEDKDLRKRGLAAYIAVKLWKNESHPYMRAMLCEESQLLQYDAMSALIMYGGDTGKEIAREHGSHETHPRLKAMLDHLD